MTRLLKWIEGTVMLMGGVGCLVCNRDVRTEDGLCFQWCYGMGGWLFVCFFFPEMRVQRMENGSK